MGRTITSGMQTAIASEGSSLFHFIQLDFSGGIVYLTTAPHDVLWNSQTWQGVGGLLVIDIAQETQDLSASNITLNLSGVDQSIINNILGEFFIGRNAKVWMAHLDSSGAIVADPLLIFSGKMNGGFEIEELVDSDAPGTVNIKGRMVDRLGDLLHIAGIKASVESHQIYFDGDMFFEFAQLMVNIRLDWGRPSNVVEGIRRPL